MAKICQREGEREEEREREREGEGGRKEKREREGGRERKTKKREKGERERERELVIRLPDTQAMKNSLAELGSSSINICDLSSSNGRVRLVFV